MSDKEVKSDLSEYIKQDGAKEISADNPYNDTDALVLSNMAYIRFEDILPKNLTTSDDTIGEYAKVYMETTGYSGADENGKALIEGLATNPRYKDLKLTNIEAAYSETEPIQFAAMTVELPNNENEIEKVAVFRGTDKHITSWWEDFTFTYNSNPEASVAQQMAVDYINNMGDVDKLYMTGHSKAGGEDEWAALFCNDEIKAKIVSIISLDGPGLRKDIKEENKEAYDALRKQLGDAWYTIAPKESLVGFLMTDPENVKIVESTASAIAQHTSNTWIFKNGQLDSGEINTREPGMLSKFMNDTLDDSLSLIPKPILKVVIDTGAKLGINYANGTLDDKIAQYFDGYKEIVDRIDDEEGFLNVLKNTAIAESKVQAKLAEGAVNVLVTESSMLYTLGIAITAAKKNLDQIAIEYVAKELSDGVEYIEQKAINGIEYGLSQYFDSPTVYRKMGNIPVEEGAAAWVEDDSTVYGDEYILDEDIDNGNKNYSMSAIDLVYISLGLELVQYGLSYIDNIKMNTETDKVSKEEYVDSINKYIKDIILNTKQWESILSVTGIDKIKETNKLLRTIHDIGEKMSQYVSNFLGIGSGVLGSSFQQQSISCTLASGEVGLEFSLIPRINNIIDEVVDNYNVSTKNDLDDIMSQLSKLRYTSFSIGGQIEDCKDSLKKQKQSLYDFRDSLEEYNSIVREMEQEVITKLGEIELDCKAV